MKAEGSCRLMRCELEFLSPSAFQNRPQCPCANSTHKQSYAPGRLFRGGPAGPARRGYENWPLHLTSSLSSLGLGYWRNLSSAPKVYLGKITRFKLQPSHQLLPSSNHGPRRHLTAAFPATRPNTTQSRRELPPRRLLPWIPPAASPATYRPESRGGTELWWGECHIQHADVDATVEHWGV